MTSLIVISHSPISCVLANACMSSDASAGGAGTTAAPTQGKISTKIY